jgi:hypothetical protein
MDEKNVYATEEAARRNCGADEWVYRVYNPYRAPLYVVAIKPSDALILACEVWDIRADALKS